MRHATARLQPRRARLDADRGYWAVIGMQNGLGGAVGGVTLEQQLQPLVNAYLGQP